jgi:hypothetical protein
MVLRAFATEASAAIISAFLLDCALRFTVTEAVFTLVLDWTVTTGAAAAVFPAVFVDAIRFAEAVTVLAGLIQADAFPTTTPAAVFPADFAVIAIGQALADSIGCADRLVVALPTISTAAVAATFLRGTVRGAADAFILGIALFTHRTLSA